MSEQSKPITVGIRFIPLTEALIPPTLKMMESFYKIDGYPFNASITTTNLKKFITDENLGKGWHIIIDELVVGYVLLCFGFSFEFGGRDCFLDELFIKENFRGMGVGTRAVDFIIQNAPSFGIKAVHLEVELKNDAALSIYRKKGFYEHNRRLMTKKL